LEIDLKSIIYKEEIKKIIKEQKNIYIIIYIIIFSLRPIFPVPFSIMTVCSGILFGMIYGTLISIIGAVSGATITYYLSRFLGKDYIDTILGNKFVEI